MIPRQYAKILYEITLGKKGEELELAIAEFINFLKGEYVFSKVNYIIAEFEKYAKKKEGILDIQVKSAKKLAPSTLDAIKKSFGKKVNIQSEIDESIIGGIILNTGDKILDGSIKTQLEVLKRELIQQ